MPHALQRVAWIQERLVISVTSCLPCTRQSPLLPGCWLGFHTGEARAQCRPRFGTIKERLNTVKLNTKS